MKAFVTGTTGYVCSEDVFICTDTDADAANKITYMAFVRNERLGSVSYFYQLEDVQNWSITNNWDLNRCFNANGQILRP